MQYAVLQADIDKDREILNQLWQRNFSLLPEGRFQWIYKDSPSGYPTCFLLQETRTGSIVGAFSLFPRTLFIDGKSVHGLICGDLVVDRGHRAIGPALNLVKSAISICDRNNSGILFGIPNKNSFIICQRAGFEILDDIYEMTLVLRTYSYIRRITHFPIIAYPLSFLIDFAFRVGKTDTFKIRKKKYVIDFPSRFDEKFDDLWYRLLKEYSFIGERSSRFLEWRFNQSPHDEYRVFTLAYRRGMPFLGYVIFGVDGRRVRVADIGFDGTEKALTELISSFSSYQRAQGAEAISLSIAGHPKIIALFQKLGYSLRSRKQRVLIYAPPKLKTILKNINNVQWFLTLADNDI